MSPIAELWKDGRRSRIKFPLTVHFSQQCQLTPRVSSTIIELWNEKDRGFPCLPLTDAVVLELKRQAPEACLLSELESLDEEDWD